MSSSSSQEEEPLSNLTFGKWELQGTTLTPTKKLLDSVLHSLQQNITKDRIFSFHFGTSFPSSSTPVYIHQSVLTAPDSSDPLRLLVTAPFLECSSSSITLEDENSNSFHAIRCFLYARPIHLTSYNFKLALCAHKWELTPLFDAFFAAHMRKYQDDVIILVNLAINCHHVTLPSIFLSHLAFKIAQNIILIEDHFGKDQIWGINHDDDFICKSENNGEILDGVANSDEEVNMYHADVDEREAKGLISDKEKHELCVQRDEKSNRISARSKNIQINDTNVNSTNSNSTIGIKKTKDNRYDEPNTTSHECNNSIDKSNNTYLRFWKFLNSQHILVDVIKYIQYYTQHDRFDLLLHVAYNLENVLSDKELEQIMYHLGITELLASEKLEYDDDKPLSYRMYQIGVKLHVSQSKKFRQNISFCSKTSKKTFEWKWPWGPKECKMNADGMGEARCRIEVKGDLTIIRIYGSDVKDSHQGRIMIRMMNHGCLCHNHEEKQPIEFLAEYLPNGYPHDSGYGYGYCQSLIFRVMGITQLNDLVEVHQKECKFIICVQTMLYSADSNPLSWSY